MVADLSLMQCANPLLFSEGNYEEYPFEYQDLKRYLSTNDDGENTPCRNVKPFTHINYLDMLLYPNDGNFDLNRKLVCEYALFQVQRSERLNKLPQLDNFYQLENLKQLEPFTAKWYQFIIVLLESINATNIESLLLKGPHPLKMLEQMTGTDLQTRTPTDSSTAGTLQELTSYVVSRAVQRNIELKPLHLDDQVEFLKTAFDTILDNGAPTRSMSHDDDKQNLQTAVNDLQLANTFLTKQFQNDHADYVQNIEKLQRTNKELQQKVLDYHSELVKSEQKLQEKEKLVKEMEDATSSNKSSNFNYASPVMTNEMWFPSSPASTNSNNSVSSASQSIGVMRTEFKKLLTETQRKHDRELQSERESRLKLEKELQQLRQSKGY